MSNNYIKSYHGLRGVAALMVFFAHSLGGYLKYNDYKLSLAEELVNTGVFGVEIFFLLSGYFIYNSACNLEISEFMKRRFFRIYPIFLFFTLVFFVINDFLDVYPGKNSYYYLFLNLTFLNLFFSTPALTPNAWSLTYEVVFYFFSYCILSKTTHRFYKIIGYLCFFYMIFYFPITIYFLAGVIISYKKDEINLFFSNFNSSYKNAFSVILFFLLLFFISKERDYSNWQVVYSNVNTILAFLIMILLMLFIKDEKNIFFSVLGRPLFLFLGTISYSFYLAHPYSYKAILYLLNWVGQPNISENFSFLMFFILNTIFSVVFSYFIYLFIEKKFSNGIVLNIKKKKKL